MLPEARNGNTHWAIHALSQADKQQKECCMYVTPSMHGARLVHSKKSAARPKWENALSRLRTKPDWRIAKRVLQGQRR
eukprot:174126-Pelagomonas_calceolata.AAC.5